MSDGAYSFLVLFMAKYGTSAVHIISRTTSGSWNSYHKGVMIECYIVRFLRQTIMQLGMDDNQISITWKKSGWHGKGICAKKAGITHMLDNDPECLYSVLVDKTGNAYSSISSYSDTRSRPGKIFQFTLHEKTAAPWWIRDIPEEDNEKIQTHLLFIKNWMELAAYFDLPYRDELWEAIRLQGPPHKRPATMLAQDVIDMCHGSQLMFYPDYHQPEGETPQTGDAPHDAAPATVRMDYEADEFNTYDDGSMMLHYFQQPPNDYYPVDENMSWQESAGHPADDVDMWQHPQPVVGNDQPTAGSDQATEEYVDAIPHGTGSPDTGSPRPTLGGVGSPHTSLPGSMPGSACQAAYQARIDQLSATVERLLGEVEQAKEAALNATVTAQHAATAVTAAAAAAVTPQPPQPQARAPQPHPPPTAPPVWAEWKHGKQQGQGWLEKKVARAQRHASGDRPPQGTAAPSLPMCQWCGKNQPGRHCIYESCRSCCDSYRQQLRAMPGWTGKDCWLHGRA